MIQSSIRRAVLSGLVLLGVLSLGACSGGTKFTGTWTNPEYAQSQQVDDVLVVAISENTTSRRIWETELARQLERQGVRAWPSIQIHPAVEQLPKEKAEALIAEHGIEAVIVTRLLDVDRQDVYVPPTTYVSSYPTYGQPYYGNWYGYYSASYTVSHDPGYTYEKVTVVLETNLYDASNGEIIWSGQSNTLDPGGVNDVIEPTTALIVEELVINKLLHPKK
jgi:hypothetical protein